MIYALGDLHLDYSKEKDMAVFGEAWKNYEEKIFENWKKTINEGDLVLIPGDISWAMNLEEAKKDLDRIDKLPGSKLLLKGNHDYWWSSLNKIKKLGLKTIEFLQNDAYDFSNYIIAGTRSWISRDSKDFKLDDEKIFKRELLRLEMSLEEAKKLKKNRESMEIIGMIHYPPFNCDRSPNEFAKIFEDYGVKKVVYGHLHGPALNTLREGEVNGVEYFCVSGDYLDFIPKNIELNE